METPLTDLIQTHWRKAQLAELPAPGISLPTWAEAEKLMEPICVACDDPAADRCASSGEWYCRGCLSRATDDQDPPYCHDCADHLAGERIQLARQGVYSIGWLVALFKEGCKRNKGKSADVGLARGAADRPAPTPEISPF